MRRLTGIILMATVAYAGHIGINHYFTDNFKEKAAFSNLRTKLQKTLVMIDVSPEIENKAKESKTIQIIKKKSSATRAAANPSKSDVILTMKKTYDSLAEVSHIFRHEVSEMINILDKSVPMKKLNAKLTYAKNWSNYIQNNVQKFNMSQDNKDRISSMVIDMQTYIAGLTESRASSAAPVVLAPKVQPKPQPIIVEKKIVSAKVEKTLPVVVATPVVKDTVDTIVKKSITESLVALKKWENSRKEASLIVESFSSIWLAVVGIFAMIALWMSSTKSEDKLIVTQEGADEDSFVEPDFKNTEMIEVLSEKVVENDEKDENETDIIKFVENIETTEAIETIETSYFFDEISNSLSTLCQARGIILDTDELDDCSDIVSKYQLSHVEQEIEDFTKTIIRSLGKEGTKTVKLQLQEKLTKLKIVAKVTSENSLDINMTRIASGFRDLEEKLSNRKGVFNIEQSVSGNDIDFVMQLTADDNSEINDVEQVEVVPPTV